MEKLFLNTRRDGYAPEQCDGSLTVRELIEILEQYDDDTEVLFKNDGGYTYGCICESNIEFGDE
jgi:hypothetical protein